MQSLFYGKYFLHFVEMQKKKPQKTDLTFLDL